jgi:hypothetical protein
VIAPMRSLWGGTEWADSLRAPRFWATLDADSIRSFLPDLPVLLPVASFQRRDYRLRRPPCLPVRRAPVAVDTGAFAWFRSYSLYHFSAQQLADWIAGIRPPVSWAVIPDRPTEELGGSLEIRRAQEQTTQAIVHVLESLLDVPWAWAPVLQGRTVDDYLRHAVDLADIIYELAPVHNRRGIPFRVGVGSICRRAQVDDVRHIIAAVATVLPNVPLHLLGRLGPVICHFHCVRSPPFDPGQSFLGGDRPQEQRGVF